MPKFILTLEFKNLFVNLSNKVIIMSLSIVVLAAGEGTRMHSQTPKVLHLLGGKPILKHVLDTLKEVNTTITPIVICGYQKEKIQENLHTMPVNWVTQLEQLGTAHALQQALPNIPTDHRVLVLCGDVPLISAQTLKNFISTTPENTVGLLTAQVENPTGLGRICRDGKDQISHIIEEKDATDREKKITEINTGIYLFPKNFLAQQLATLSNQNAQQEFYLTDIIPAALKLGISIHDAQPENIFEILGVNNREQLANLERIYQYQLAKNFMHQGVSFADPNRFDLRGHAIIAEDVMIDINVILEGEVKIGQRCKIGPNTLLRNVTLADDVEIKAHCVLEDTEISANSIIGPFARLRPGTKLGLRTRVGNFVEIKNSTIGNDSKINHLSYIGDSDVGAYVNIGAGTITCNYDGLNKNKTIIKDHAFIGSNTALIAPIIIEEGATIGAGSVLTRTAPANKLTLTRSKQSTIEKWQRKK
jgi:bifunctional UDP-N-acetylglucosamine pyrophosphorylase/glucosamine-1-phosphate N-acetyltransferase